MLLQKNNNDTTQYTHRLKWSILDWEMRENNCKHEPNNWGIRDLYLCHIGRSRKAFLNNMYNAWVLYTYTLLDYADQPWSLQCMRHDNKEKYFCCTAFWVIQWGIMFEYSEYSTLVWDYQICLRGSYFLGSVSFHLNERPYLAVACLQ